MALSMQKSRARETLRSPLAIIGGVCIVLGLVATVAGFLLRGHEAAQAYQYTITQSLTPEITYHENSYFDANPVKNSVYISDLVDSVHLALNYQYRANSTANLTYSYSATALVSAQYTSASDTSDKSADAWSKSYVLTPTATEQSSSADIRVSPDVTVPFQEYRAAVSQLTEGLDVSLTGQATITFTVRVSGEVNGQQLNDVRTSTVLVPLDQPVFSPEVTTEKQASATITAPAPAKNWLQCKTVFIVAALLALIGIVLVFVGARRRGGISSYDRELAKIMRYHEGVIVRATEPVDMTGKQLVVLRSFDDMLNLEEELRQPIVAVPAGAEAMYFVIIHEGVLYRYTLGRPPVSDSAEVTAASRSITSSRARRKS